MGYWGPGSLENDQALDWLSNLAEENDSAVVLDLLSAGASTSLSEDECCNILAGCEVVAAARGWHCEDLPEAVNGFIARCAFSPDDVLASKAIEIIAALKNNSQLRDLWKEEDSISEWNKCLSELTSRLKKKAKKVTHGSLSVAPIESAPQTIKGKKETLSAQEYLERARKMADKDKYDLSIEDFRLSVSADPSLAKTIASEAFRIGNELSTKMRDKHALKFYDLSIEQGTEFEYSWTFPDPTGDGKVITKNYNRNSALYRRASALCDLRRYDEGLIACVEAAMTTPAVADEIFDFLDSFISDRKNDLCIQFAERFLSEIDCEPDQKCFLLACLALARMDLKQIPEALSDAEQSVEIFESYPEAERRQKHRRLLAMMGLLYWERSWLFFKSKDQKQKALFAHDRDQYLSFGRGLIRPARPDFERALAARDKGDFKKAISIYKTALEYDPSDLHVWFALAQTYENAGENELAAQAHKHIDETRAASNTKWTC